MLKEMRHARALSGLVLRADVVHDGYGDDGGAVVLVEDDVEAVCQIELDVLDLRRLGPHEAVRTEQKPRKEEG